MAENEQDDQTQQNEKISLLQQALLDEQTARAKSEADKAALVEEFSKADTYDEQMEIAKEAIAEMLPLAIMTAKEILGNGENEGTRAGLSKYVMETVLSGKLDKAGENAVADLLKALGANDKPEVVTEPTPQASE